MIYSDSLLIIAWSSNAAKIRSLISRTAATLVRVARVVPAVKARAPCHREGAPRNDPKVSESVSRFNVYESYKWIVKRMCNPRLFFADSLAPGFLFVWLMRYDRVNAHQTVLNSKMRNLRTRFTFAEIHKSVKIILYVRYVCIVRPPSAYCSIPYSLSHNE